MSVLESRMGAVESEVVRQVGFRIARADLSYVHSALLRPSTRQMFLQWASVVAFEARNFVARDPDDRVVAVDAQSPWAHARHSIKHLGDGQRPHPEVLSYLDALVRSNRSAFFSPGRRLRLLDRFRDDLALTLLDGRPALSNISGLFGMGVGVDPLIAAEWSALSGHARDRGYEIGQTIALLTGETLPEHAGPLIEAVRITHTDSKSDQVFRAMFGGGLAFGLVGVLSSIAHGLVVVEKLAVSRCCSDCRFAAFKQRLVAVHHAKESLALLANGNPRVPQHVQDRTAEIVGSKEVRLVDGEQWRKARNGLLHLGVGDLPPDVLKSLAEEDLWAVAEAYVHRPEPELSSNVDVALHHLSAQLEAWCVSGPAGGASYLRLLREVQV